jgi:hypothetical protein
MMFLFTTSDKIGARAIRYLTGSPASHFVVSFDESPNGFGIVFHSSFHGVRIEWLNDFLKRNRIIFALKPKRELGLEGEEAVYQALVSSFYGKNYDWSLFAAFTFYAIRKRITGKDFPQKTPMNNAHAYLCTEIAKRIQQVKPEYFGVTLPETFVTPYEMYLSMDRSAELVDVSGSDGINQISA